MLPWNLLQLISYFFAFIIYSINLLKTDRKTFAIGNAIYPLSRTIIQITSDNSIFRKEGFAITRVIVLASSYLFLTGYVHFRLHNCKRHKTFKKLKKMYSYSNKIRFIGIILFSFLYRPISVDSMRAVFLFHILNDRNN